jgi:UDP-N-acetylmuramate--alanine ligase
MQASDVAEGLKRFTGMKRRFDVCGTKPVFITDYGHSPESIRHIIGEIRTVFPQRKLHMIFQPHLFSRTYNFLDDFASALAAADKISLIDIYPAREKKEEWENRVSSEMLAKKTAVFNSNTKYCGSPQMIAENLRDSIDTDDVVCLMGAGDMDRYYGELIGYFNKESK